MVCFMMAPHVVGAGQQHVGKNRGSRSAACEGKLNVYLQHLQKGTHQNPNSEIEF